MPDMDGFALAEQIRRDHAHHSATIMMLTSGSLLEDGRRCRALGLAAHLVKPIKQRDLFDAICLALGGTPSTQVLPQSAYALSDSAQGLTVLVAEDNPINQRLAKRLLEKHGHHVTLVENGREALAAIERARFDLVLMDVQMPEMSGLEATAALREQEKHTGRHLPVIALTAHAMSGDRERCLEAGADEYLSKPVHARELCEKLAIFFPGRSELESELPVCVDRNALLNRLEGDEELLCLLVETFLATIPNDLAQLEAAVANGNLAEVRRLAHSLRGSVCHFGADGILEVATRLETSAATGKRDPLAGDLSRLIRGCTELREILGGFLPQPAS
jgi:CheY-like chemotaxis protein